MKKIFLLALLTIGFCGLINAQNVEITPFGGYVFPANWNGPDGSLHFDGNAQYGGSISFAISKVVDFEFTYNRIDTKVDVNGYYYSTDQVGISQNFYMIGFVKNFRINEKVSPFVGFNLGGAYFSPEDSDYYDYWFFAMGMDAGAKIYLSKRIGLRLQAQLLMPVNGGGFTFYYGGASTYLNTAMFDFGFTGGLIFRLGKTN